MTSICYFPSLEGQSDEISRWLSDAAGRFGIIPVMFPKVDWNHDLTPWPSGAIFKKGKSFGGKASDYLERLENDIIPSIEEQLGITPDERWLAGVSLAGLFAVWTAAKSGMFTRIASISGSFWYPGFTDWLRERTLNIAEAYISLGDKESMGKNPRLKDIGTETAEVVNILRAKGIRTSFEWTEGTHFSPVIPRLEKALLALSGTTPHTRTSE